MEFGFCTVEKPYHERLSNATPKFKPWNKTNSLFEDFDNDSIHNNPFNGKLNKG